MNPWPNWVYTYLDILNVDPQPITYEFLESICTQHLKTFPFENVSKLMDARDCDRWRRLIPNADEFLDRFRKHQFGGTCFTLNTNLFQLLKQLGFECRLTMLGNAHMAILVNMEDLTDDWVYVDCGAAAPMFQPVRFATDPDHVTRFGRDEIFIRPLENALGTYRYQRYMNGEPSGDAWDFEPARNPSYEEFIPLIEKSMEPGTTFMSILRCQIWQPEFNRSVSLVNNKLSLRFKDGTVKTRVPDEITDIEQALEEEFRLPRLPVREAIGILESLGVDIFSST